MARSLKTCNVCGIVLCDKTEHFRVAFYCGQFLHGQHTHRTCHPLSMFGMLWIRQLYDMYTTACSSSCHYSQCGVDQHSTGHNQQPDQLYVKEM